MIGTEQSSDFVIMPFEFELSQVPDHKAPPLYAIAGKKNHSDEIIVKVVNTSGHAQGATLTLNDSPDIIGASATVWILARPDAENSFEVTSRIARTVADLGHLRSPFDYTFAPHSTTLFRLKTK